MGVVSRKWMWVKSMGVASGYGCKEVYIYHTYQPTKPSSRDSVTQKSGILFKKEGRTYNKP